MNIENLKDVFTNHVEDYDMNERAIQKKYYHSFRVMDFCKEIAHNIDLNEEDTYLAMVIGLLHDYSRFEQWQKFKTYSDISSVDHADLAIERLFEDSEIKNFNIREDYYEIISDAIKYHNKYSYPENLAERNKLFCKIIRDADKLDIIYLLGLVEDKVKEDEADISENVKENFYNNKLIKRVKGISNSDNVILKLAMIFDLNFEYSYKYISDNKLMDKMLETLEYKDKFKPYFNYANEYVKERNKRYVRKKI